MGGGGIATPSSRNGESRAARGDRYVGEWADGKMHGAGATTYANGNRYTGAFKEDRRCATLFYALWGRGWALSRFVRAVGPP